MKRLRLTWWHWIMLILFLLIAFTYGGLAALRMSGISTYEATTQQLSAQGKISTVDAYIDALPPVNSNLQDAWRNWADRGPVYPDNQHLDAMLPDNVVLIYQKDKNFISDLQTQVNDLRVDMSDGVKLVTDPNLILSSNGFLGLLPKGKRDLTSFGNAIPSLLATRSLMLWLHDEALLSSNPHSVLAVQDRLVAALQPPGFVIDAMILIAINEIRDETYLHCSLFGTLSAEDRNRWLAEPSQAIQQLGGTFKVESFFVEASMDIYLQQSLLPFVFGGGMEELHGISRHATSVDPLQWPHAAWTWARHGRNSADLLTTYSAISDRLLGHSHEDYASLQVRINNNGIMEKMSASNMYECCHTALEADAKHRLFRLAVRLIEHARAHDLPASHADLLTLPDMNQLISPPGDHLHLIYERLSPSQFRVGVSPTSPVPNFEDGSRMPARTAEFGKPATDYPLVIERTSIEIRLLDFVPY